jgi:hypothetical protein
MLIELDAQLSFLLGQRPYLSTELEPRVPYPRFFEEEPRHLRSLIINFSSLLLEACHNATLSNKRVKSYLESLESQQRRLSEYSTSIREDSVLSNAVREYQFMAKLFMLALHCQDTGSAERERVIEQAQEIHDMFHGQESTYQTWPYIFGAYCVTRILATYSKIIHFPLREDDLNPGDDGAQFITCSHSMPGPKTKEPRLPVPNVPAQLNTEARQKNCLTCIARRVKCDRQRPYCSKCLDDRKVCSGYKSGFTWVNSVASRGKVRGLSIGTVGTPEGEQHTTSAEFPTPFPYSTSQLSMADVDLSGQGQKPQEAPDGRISSVMIPPQSYPTGYTSEATSASFMQFLAGNMPSAQAVALGADSNMIFPDDFEGHHHKMPNSTTWISNGYGWQSLGQENYTPFPFQI